MKRFFIKVNLIFFHLCVCLQAQACQHESNEVIGKTAKDCFLKRFVCSDKKKINYLSWAISSGNVELLKIFSIDKKEFEYLNELAPFSFAFLTVDALENSLEMLRVIEGAGVDFNSIKMGGESIVYHSIEMDSKELIEYFKDAEKYEEVFLNDRNVLAAASSGNLDLLKHLVSKGLNINVKDKNGFGALDYALARGSDNVIDFLKKSSLKENRIKE